ncbi:MAG: GNAT family N-acetyltransferase [Candidatus Cloacimonetes bacterium]|nr:GNAT family N-acetyltransferase [Candidatus Cloacimonadota bacterium]
MNPKTNIAAIINILGKSRMKNFSAHIPIRIEKKNFIVKTADSREELYTALKLRHDIFLDELLKKRRRSGLDKDRFDKLCDHLIIIDKRTNKMIGTYRLQSSLFTKKWYTAKEFHMKHIKKLPGTKLELGRACVHPDFRNGVTIALLWEGITAYIEASDTNYLFGCSSIKTMNKEEIREIYHYLSSQGHMLDLHKLRPRTKFRVPGFKRQLRRNPSHKLSLELNHRELIPSLLFSYLKAGAKVCGAPALDKSFKCIDFLTLLSADEIKHRSRIKQDDPETEE